VLAAQRGTSISGLLTRQIEEMVEKDDAYQQAKTRALSMLHSGFGFDGIQYMTREEMHDRKNFR
jgi:cytosine/adenosine deaminase-related metal-dependent hydrolase